MGTFITLIVAHYIGDFILQPRWMGTGKSSSFKILIQHILIYSLTITLIVTLTSVLFNNFELTNLLQLFIFVFIGHIGVDFWTSKLSSKIYETYLLTNDTDDMYSFWCIIGLDQTLHIIHLYLIFLFFNL